MYVKPKRELKKKDMQTDSNLTNRSMCRLLPTTPTTECKELSISPRGSYGVFQPEVCISFSQTCSFWDSKIAIAVNRITMVAVFQQRSMHHLDVLIADRAHISSDDYQMVYVLQSVVTVLLMASMYFIQIFRGNFSPSFNTGRHIFTLVDIHNLVVYMLSRVNHTIADDSYSWRIIFWSITY